MSYRLISVDNVIWLYKCLVAFSSRIVWETGSENSSLVQSLLFTAADVATKPVTFQMFSI